MSKEREKPLLGEFDPLAESFEYNSEGVLELTPRMIPGLPGKLTIEKGGDKSFKVSLERGPALKNAEVLGMNFFKVKEIYWPEKERLDDELLDKLSEGNQWGKELQENGEVEIGEGQCLIIKKRTSDGSLGGDVLRLNIGENDVENVIIDRVIEIEPNKDLTRGLRLEELLRWGMEKTVVFQPEMQRAAVVPGANVIRLKGCMPMRGKTEEGLPLPAPYLTIEDFKMRLEKDNGLSLTVCGIRTKQIYVDEKGKRKVGMEKIPGTDTYRTGFMPVREERIPFPGLGVYSNGEWQENCLMRSIKPLEVDSISSTIEELGEQGRGLIVITRGNLMDPDRGMDAVQDLASLLVLKVNGRLRLYYIRGTDHGGPPEPGGIVYKSRLKSMRMGDDLGVKAEEGNLLPKDENKLIINDVSLFDLQDRLQRAAEREGIKDGGPTQLEGPENIYTVGSGR